MGSSSTHGLETKAAGQVEQSIDQAEGKRELLPKTENSSHPNVPSTPTPTNQSKNIQVGAIYRLKLTSYSDPSLRLRFLKPYLICF
jgi:hypothetical protein